MRVLFVSQVYFPDSGRGAERVCEDQVLHFRGLGHDVHVMSLGPKLETLQHDDGYLIHRLPFGQSPRPGASELKSGPIGKIIWHARNAVSGVSQQALEEKLRSLAPDVVYVHNATGFQPQLFNSCRLLRLPVVLHLHDYSYLCPRTTMFHAARNCSVPCRSCRILTHQWRRAAEMVGDVVSISAFVANRYRENRAMGRARWHVVHNTDDTSLTGFSPKRHGPFTFGFIGALTEQKGLSQLIDAILHLPTENQHLVIAGQGDASYVDPLKVRCASAGAQIAWLGHTDPNTLFSQIDCLVVPSLWHEPQGLVIAEARRRGIPIIATMRGGITEVLSGREPHMLYDPDNSTALVQALRDMASSQLVPPSPEKPGSETMDHIVRIVENAVGHSKTQ